MKHLRHFCVASALTFALALSTFAGDINCGVVSTPPNPPASVTGDMPNGVAATNEESAETAFVDPVTEVTLSILQDLLSLF